MKLGIVIPALNEEASIEKIILATHQAKDFIIKNSPVSEVEIIVVSDGSTDQTVELAQQHLDKIKLIIFEKNKGYGAAIKQGWEETDADLVSFLDADGTCNPEFFAPLCTELEKGKQDVMLGCRLNKDSKMPAIRRFGNTLFAILLSLVSNQRVRDTASGMRVIRRNSLSELMPLPDGLHFTPAMSARAILHPDLKIGEIDMPYQERDGESKLKVWRDGIRFLKVILEMTFLYQPQRVFFLTGFFIAFLALLIMLMPVSHFMQNKSLEDWMNYRFMVANFMGTLSLISFLASFISEKVVNISLSGKEGHTRPLIIPTNRFFIHSASHWFATFCLIVGFSLVANSLFDRLATGATNEHWSRYIAMSFLVSVASAIWIAKGLNFILTLIEERMNYLHNKK